MLSIFNSYTHMRSYLNVVKYVLRSLIHAIFDMVATVIAY